MTEERCHSSAALAESECGSIELPPNVMDGDRSMDLDTIATPDALVKAGEQIMLRLFSSKHLPQDHGTSMTQ